MGVVHNEAGKCKIAALGGSDQGTVGGAHPTGDGLSQSFALAESWLLTAIFIQKVMGGHFRLELLAQDDLC